MKQIIYILVFIVVAFAITGNVSAKNDKVFDIIRYRNYVVLTGSMEPSISPGDYICVRKVNVDKLKEGDIITFNLNGTIVTHQIVNIEGDSITTQGTANNISDEPIEKKQVIGKYMFKLPQVGRLMAFLSSTAGLILVFGIIAIIIFWDLTDPERDKNKKKYQDDMQDLNHQELLDELEELREYKKQKELEELREYKKQKELEELEKYNKQEESKQEKIQNQTDAENKEDVQVDNNHKIKESINDIEERIQKQIDLDKQYKEIEYKQEEVKKVEPIKQKIEEEVKRDDEIDNSYNITGSLANRAARHRKRK